MNFFVLGERKESAIKAWYSLNSNEKPIVDFYWSTMSPGAWNYMHAEYSPDLESLVLSVYAEEGEDSTGGILTTFPSYMTLGVRPVISLNSCVKVTGIGRPDNPYVVDYDGSCKQSIHMNSFFVKLEIKRLTNTYDKWYSIRVWIY